MAGHCENGSTLLDPVTPRVETYKEPACHNIRNESKSDIKRADTVEVIGGCPVRWVRDVCPGRCGGIEFLKASAIYEIYPEGGVTEAIAVGDTVSVNGVDYIAVPRASSNPSDPAAVAGQCSVLGVCK